MNIYPACVLLSVASQLIGRISATQLLKHSAHQSSSGGGHLDDTSKSNTKYQHLFQTHASVANRHRTNAGATSLVVAPQKAQEGQIQSVDQHEDAAGHMVIICLLLSFVGYVAYRAVLLYISYIGSIKGNFSHKGFKEYLDYSFEQWFVNTPRANAHIIFFATIATLLLGSLVYALLLHTNIFIALWRVFTWILDPGAAVAVPENQLKGIILGGTIGVVGLVIFGLLLTLMQDTFVQYLNYLQSGSSPVMEANHVMIIGFTEETIPLISQLCLAYEYARGTAIVVFSDNFTKAEMEDKIEEAELNLLGSRIIVRCGKPYLEQDLKSVAAHTARSIILLPERDTPRPMKDALQLRTLSTLRGCGWPMNGRILVVCSLYLNLKLLKSVGGSVTDVVLLHRFIAKLFVQYSQEQGLRSVFDEMLGFQGHDLCIQDVPERLHGKTFAETKLYFPDAVPLGILKGEAADSESLESVSSTHCMFCPESSEPLSPGCKLALLAQDASVVAAETPVAAYVDVVREHKLPSRRKSIVSPDAEKVLILGWNSNSGEVILEIDLIMSHPDSVQGKKSELVIVAMRNIEERNMILKQTQKRNQQDIKNLSITQVEGPVSSRAVLEELEIPVEKFDRIFILADDGADSALDADASSMCAAMQVREMISERHGGKAPQMVVEIRNSVSLQRCQDLKLRGCVDAVGLPSKIIAMLAFKYELFSVLMELVSEEGSAQVSIHSLTHYLKGEAQDSYSFFEISAMACAVGHILIGWSKPEETGELIKSKSSVLRDEFCKTMTGKSFSMVEMEHTKTDWELNPPNKSNPRRWCLQQDRVVVMSLRR